MRPIKNFDFLFKINRREYFKDTTIGDISAPESFSKKIWTLEDTVRAHGIKVKAHTAIPDTGISLAYNLGIRYSPRFKREMPVIYSEIIKENGQDVYIVRGIGGVEFRYAQIHGGNDHTNTEGCPLVCYNRVSDTRIQGTAEKEVTELVKKYLKLGKVGISIINGR